MPTRTGLHCCILPPHVLRSIAKHGNAQQQDRALRTLAASERFRGRRELLATLPIVTPAGTKRRTVYDGQSERALPGALARGEGDPASKDPAVNEAYDGAGTTYDFYREAYERNSLDDRGMRLDSTVHYGKQYQNAFWNGQQMVYGDGDGDLFVRFTLALDVIGHELSHGVVQYEANLDYEGQSGALNESLADVFGSLVRQWSLDQTAEQADWLIGKDIFTPKIAGDALRSLKKPGSAYDDPVLGKDPQPMHMSGYQNLDYDNGGVHINSGIPNHAFYLAATKIGGHAWEKAGRIWYVTLRDRLRHSASFQDAANHTVRVAGELYGGGSAEQKAVQEAWEGVGLKASLAAGTNGPSKRGPRPVAPR
jgi:Zn-dependent metalloprotease